jgi:hypothetical protein
MRIALFSARISLLTILSAISILTTQAQPTPTASDRTIDHCVRWLKATVNEGMWHQLDPADFCAGVQLNNVGGWVSDTVCGNAPEQHAGSAPSYCSSAGQISPSEAWAAGFGSSSGDGGELLADAYDRGTQSPRAAAVFYTRTATWIGDLRISPGMYKLVPQRSTAGWRLAVSREGGGFVASAALQKNLGAIEATANRPPNHLLVWIRPDSHTCPGPSTDIEVRELHFIFESTDLFFCVRPDPVPPERGQAEPRAPNPRQATDLRQAPTFSDT